VATAPIPVRRGRRNRRTFESATLRVLGRERALLEVISASGESIVELSGRHAEILLMLAVHRDGLSADRLTELIYGEDAGEGTLRPEMVRLRKVLERRSPHLVPSSRPYRLPADVSTDAHEVLSLLDRGAHRVALAAYRGAVLPDSVAPGVEAFRATVAATLREAMLSEASVEVLLAYADTAEAEEDAEILRLALSMLPARSPRRAGLVARLEALDD
jgi:transcriptional regulator